MLVSEFEQLSMFDLPEMTPSQEKIWNWPGQLGSLKRTRFRRYTKFNERIEHFFFFKILKLLPSPALFAPHHNHVHSSSTTMLHFTGRRRMWLFTVTWRDAYYATHESHTHARVYRPTTSVEPELRLTPFIIILYLCCTHQMLNRCSNVWRLVQASM